MLLFIVTQKKTKKQRSLGKKKIITTDRHALYEASVQSIEHDADTLIELYRQTYKKEPYLLREDFCGTHALCCEWVQRGTRHKAIGIDHCKKTLQYGEKKHRSTLSPEAQKKVQILCKDVNTTTKKVDIIAACNFSYLTFQTREKMLRYFQHCYHSLKEDGALMIDLFGGTETEEVMEEETSISHDTIKNFIYTWDLDYFNPITRRAIFYIHFRYPNKGPELKKAFTYDWRIWTIPELQELMLEAGFKDVRIFWEGVDRKGEGNGIFYPTAEEENELTWIVYIVGSKKKSKAKIRKK